MRNERVEQFDVDLDLDRRRALKLLGGGLTTVVAGKAVDNVLLGYELLGTNLRKQELATLVSDGFFAGVRRTDVGAHRLVLWGDTLRIQQGKDVLSKHRYPELSTSDAERLDSRYDLDGYLATGLPVLADLHERIRPSFSNYESFFEQVREGEPVPGAVELLRSVASADPAIVRTFTDADPSEPEAVVEGLVDGFREYGGYDLERYVAGSVQDNVVFGLADLRAPFREDVDFETVMAEDGTGLFCYEFTARSIEALHAVPAREQSAPVFAGSVFDERHKHVYTVIGSVLREGDGYAVPLTFVDYTHSTLYDDLNLRGVLGEGLAAYDRRHMATQIFWS